MSVRPASHGGSTPPGDTSAGAVARVIDLASVRASRPRTPAVAGAAHARRSQSVSVVRREFAITVRAPKRGAGHALAHAIARVLRALAVPDGDRCHIEATAGGLKLPSLKIDFRAGSAQTLDTLLRSLESIIGAALRAKVVVFEGTHPRIRTWAGAWIEPERPSPHMRPAPTGPSLPPLAA